MIVVALIYTTTSCSQKKMSVKCKHPEFYSEKKVIVQNTGKFFINDIPKGEVKQ
jgi:hypothetical protein